MSDWKSIAHSVFQVCSNTFGEPITYKHKTQTESYAIQGLFRDDYSAIQESGFESVISTTIPVLELDRSRLKSPPVNGDRAFVRGSEYIVMEVKPNGIADEVKLVLRKAHE